MANRETLISDLPPPSQSGGDANLVQNIISEYQNVSSQPSAPSGPVPGGPVPGGHAPGGHAPANMPVAGVQNPVSQDELVSHDQFSNMQRNTQAPLGGQPQPGMPMRGAIDASSNGFNNQNQNQQYADADDNEYYEEVVDEHIPLTTSQLIYYHLRLPVLVAILIYLSNMRMVNLNMIKYIPKMSNRMGGLSQLGMVVKSVLFAGIFYLVATFLLK